MTQDQSPELPSEEPQGTPETPSEKSEVLQEVNDSPSVPTEPRLETPPVSPEEVSNSSSAAETQPTTDEQPISQTLQNYWNRVRPLLRAQTIKVLRVTIQALEGITNKLEKSQEVDPPQSGSVFEGIALPFSVDEVGGKVRPLWERFQVLWTKLLGWVRSRLPESLNQQLSNRALTGAIVGILIILLWTTSGLFSSKPKPTTVAIAPSPKVTTPSPKPSISPKPPIPPQVKAPAPTQPIPTKSAEEKPITQKPVEVSPSPVAKPAPPPPLKLTPEQKLIARIQGQVAEISNQYVSGLIQAVQANFRSSRLIVKVGESWYSLSEPQQNKLANEMLGRAKQLNFSKLEITGPEGTLLARSPVVGPEMIILKRANAPEKLA